MPNILISVTPPDPARAAEAMNMAIALMTAMTGPDAPGGTAGSTTRTILESHLTDRAPDAEELLQRLVDLVMAQAQVARAAALSGYAMAREFTLDHGQDTPITPDMELLMPILATILSGRGQD